MLNIYVFIKSKNLPVAVETVHNIIKKNVFKRDPFATIKG